MFKKTMLLGTVLLVSACSSTTVSTDYVNNVVVQKNTKGDYIETVGKDIVPVDLLELNLGLRMSVLSVTSKVPTPSEQATSASVEQNDNKVNSDVFFKIQYKQDQSEAGEKTPNQYNVALVDGVKMALVANNISEQCQDKACVVTQSFSFPVETALLESSTVDGLKFSLLESANNDKLMLETMIPARYITALLAP